MSPVIRQRMLVAVGVWLLSGSIRAAAAEPAPDGSSNLVPNTWVAAGLDDQFVIRVVGGDQIEGSGPFLAAQQPGRRTEKKNGTITWTFTGCEFTGRIVNDTIVMRVKGIPHADKIVFARTDAATRDAVLGTLFLINQGLQQALRLRTAKPKMIAQPVVLYPAHLVESGSSASVTVRFQVNTIGLVVDAKVESSSDPRFEAAALSAISRAIFRPGIRDGVFVNTRMTEEVNFPAPTTETNDSVSKN